MASTSATASDWHTAQQIGTRSMAKHTGPMVGVRVIDLTAMVVGPYCTQIMADMGADVIKVEPPLGDDTRYISVGPAPGMSGVFVNVNRGKRSMVLDLQTEAGTRALRALVETADVFIHSMRAKAIAKLGFGYDDVAAINPAIVYTNCYGYGRRGPDRDRPAYDDTIQAECGLPAVQQQLTGEADYVGTIMADKVAGLTALYATTMALFHRERTGEGQEVEVAMFETMASFMLVEHANGALFDPPLGPGGVSAHRGAQPPSVPHQRRPHRRVIYNDKHWNAFVDAVQPAVGHELYSTLEQRARADRHGVRPGGRDDGTALDPGMAGAVPRTRDTRRAAEHARRAVRQSAPQRRRHVRDRGHPARPGALPRRTRLVLADTGRVAGPAPELGADTEEVLAEIGLAVDANHRGLVRDNAYSTK